MSSVPFGVWFQKEGNGKQNANSNGDCGRNQPGLTIKRMRTNTHKQLDHPDKYQSLTVPSSPERQPFMATGDHHADCAEGLPEFRMRGQKLPMHHVAACESPTDHSVSQRFVDAFGNDLQHTVMHSKGCRYGPSHVRIRLCRGSNQIRNVLFPVSAR